MATAPVVGVIGMKAFLRDVAKLSSDNGPLLKQFRQAGMTAAEPVAAVTRSSLPQVTGRLAGDVRVSATKTGASVRMGRGTVRYAGWVDFGGTRRNPRVSSRPYDPRGRYLFPAGVQLAAVSSRLYSEAVQRAVDGYQWTNPGSDGAEIHD